MVSRFDTIIVVSALVATIINSAMKSCECCLFGLCDVAPQCCDA